MYQVHLPTFHVIDLANQSAPVETGNLELASGNTFAVQIAGSFAYVVTSAVGDDFHIFDVTGINAQSAFVHSFQSGTFSSLGDATIAGNAVVGKSLHSGIGGIQTDGSLFVQGSASSYITGALGIGTTTPSRSLSVVGSASLTGGFYDTSNSAGLKCYFLQSTGTSTRWRATSTLGFASAFTDSTGLRTLLSDETGTGNAVFSDSPTFTGTLLAQASSFAGLFTLTGSSANIALGSNYLSGDGGDEGVYVTGGGFVGIGTTTPNQEFSVAGTIASTDLLGGATSLSTDAQGNIIRTPSDGTLKTDVTTIEGALDTLLQLRGVSYRWLDTQRFGEQTEIGFIAQEVDLLLPEVVTKGGEYWSLNTSNMLAVVVEAVKELWQQVQGNTEEIEMLRERVEVLESELQVSNDIQEEEAIPEEIEVSEPEEAEVEPEPETPVADEGNQEDAEVSEIEEMTESTEQEDSDLVPIVEGV
jgi:hypothetical protein